MAERLNTASPFNIKVESLIIRDFNPAEIAEIYQQHTEATGQVFMPEALAYELTIGQPWLVNALARQCVEVIVKDPSVAIGVEQMHQAKEVLIRRKDTHLDSLGDSRSERLCQRLRESRVRSVLEPMMAGLELVATRDDDRDFLVDLGLLRREDGGGLVIANPIYREILPRVLAQGPQDSLPSISPTWLTALGTLDVDALRDAFVEIKVWRDRRSDPLAAGLVQLERYLTRLGLESGWLVIFDRRSTALPIEARLGTKVTQTEQGRRVTVIRG